MSPPAAPHPRQQRLGRRLGPTSYYRISVEAPGALQLDSALEANRPTGLRIAAGGIILLAIASATLFGGAFATYQNAAFSNIATAALIGGIFGGFGFQRLIGGIAVATTRNRLMVTEGQLTITQSSRIGSPRSQSIAAADVRAVQLRRRSVVTGGLIRRRRDLVALELVVGDQTWIIDGDRDPAVLQPLAVALISALGLDSAAPQPTA